jgi:Protein of unknown function (DUF1553)/Protein of unknown function (DUF1549)/Planctomycete cytochrome C
MRPTAIRRCTAKLLATVLAILLFPSQLLADESDPGKVEYFEQFIRPVLVEHCYQCHSSNAASVEGELLLDTHNGITKGGATGQAISVGKPSDSLLIKALRYQDLQMPPDRRLPDEVVQRFEKWITDGAVDPRVEATLTEAKPSRHSINWNEAREYWSLKPPQSGPLPQVELTSWPQTGIDYFVLHALETKNLLPSQLADRRTLARRVTLDLTDLPPDFDQVENFAADEAPDAWRQFVEGVIASPAFGQRWARLWLDIARYAEDQAHIVGNDRSLCYPNAYMYRDWVVEAFNQDLPYDEFVRQQLAADQVDGPIEPDLRALGFIGLGPKYYQRGSPAVMADEWEDRVDIVSRGLLGLTVACARCHDHKYDPIPTKDYYALAGVFASSQMFNQPLKPDAEKKDSGEAKKPEEALHIVRDGKPQDLNVLVRGDVKRQGELAPRGPLQLFDNVDSQSWRVGQGSGRRQLAESITQPSNPLLARVFVNRVWAALIGRPLVMTPSNFGRLGSPPSHPELLDDLASRFIQSGWSFKWLVREIVLSSTYRQSSVATDEKKQRDPENVWLSHMNRKRLSIEAWRDSMLAASGNIELTVGGPSMNPQDPKQHRRTLYSEVSRLEVNKMLSLFDFPDPNAHSERRASTTTALQKLFVLNNPFMLEQASSLVQTAENRMSIGGPTPGNDGSLATGRSRIHSALQLMYQRAYGRSPTSEEIRLFADYLIPNSLAVDPGQMQARWNEVAHVILASNELMFVD